MILICPSCETQYFADDATIGDSGRTVKCAACSHSWFVDGEGAVAKEPVSTADAEQQAVRGAHEAYREQVRQRRKRKSRIAALSSWLVMAAIFFSLGAMAVIMRNEVVRLWPESAVVYKFAGLEVNRFGLEFGPIEADRTFDGTTPVLNVSGMVYNVSRQDRVTPKVRIGLRDEYQREVAYILADIEPGTVLVDKSGRFTAKLEDPPVESFDLELSFLELGGKRSAAENVGRIEAATPVDETDVDAEGGDSPSGAPASDTED